MSTIATSTGHYPELLTDLADHVGALLKKHDIEPTRAASIGQAVAEHIRDHWGGQSLYIPQGLSYDTRLRWKRIWDEFNGDNVPELAREHDLTEVQVYKIIKHMRAEATRRNQLSLLDEGEGHAH